MQGKDLIFYKLKKEPLLSIDELCYLSGIKYHVLIGEIKEMEDDGLVKIEYPKCGSGLVSLI